MRARRPDPFGTPSIDEQLVRRLLSSQFPLWANLPIIRVAPGGWDNRTFRLGDQMLVRIPSAPSYAASIGKEQRWLPYLAPHLPLQVPEPLALGRPDCELEWEWSIYRWLPGESASSAEIADLCAFASRLAQFLKALHRVDVSDGPRPGRENFHRGGRLAAYDAEARWAIGSLQSQKDMSSISTLWERALATTWSFRPVWVHGDISPGNLLVRDGALCAVIDFGQLAVGDPACDLAIAWTLFHGESRERFRQTLRVDEDTWRRGRAWALWKALIVAAGLPGTNPNDVQHTRHVLDQISLEHPRTDV
jgi:aminoglycoside phosphotransferase (APT) family kinase protein